MRLPTSDACDGELSPPCHPERDGTPAVAVRDVSLATDPHPPPHIRLADHQQLLRLSVNRMACFAFEPGIPESAPALAILAALWDSPSWCVEVNEIFARAAETTPSALLNRPFGEIIPRTEENLELFLRWAEQRFRLLRAPTGGHERDGDKFFETSILGVAERGLITRVWFIVRDVTLLQRSILALQDAERHYRTLVERPGLVLVRTAADGSYMYISPHVHDICGHSPEEFMRTPGLFVSLIHPQDVPAHQAILDAREHQSQETVEVEYRVRNPDGTYHWMLERQTPKLDDQGEVEYYDSLAIDINERKRLECELLQAQKMEVIGALAGGIAHDFNNHLTAVLGQLTLAQRQLGTATPARASLAAAEKAALSCAEMARQLLTFGRKSEVQLTSVSMDDLLESTTELLRHLLPANIQLQLALNGRLGTVRANATQIQQVIMNIAINGRDAMPQGGELRIEGRTINHSQPVSDQRLSRLCPGSYIQVRVSDTGTGIPARILGRLFEPFFTTKSEGRGTGLGLAMASSIVQAHGGEIVAESDEGRGTTFTFYLPAAAITPPLGAQDKSQPAPPSINSSGQNK